MTNYVCPFCGEEYQATETEADEYEIYICPNCNSEVYLD